jgi:FG-GAP-like repeat
LPDAIVMGTGSNSVEVYRTTSVTDGTPTFAPSPETYFVGTAPTSVTVSDINGDGIPDLLVADQGSNDITVIAVSPGEVTPSPGGASLPTLNSFQPPAATSTQLVALTSSAIATKVVAGLFATMTLIPVISRYGRSEIHSAEDGSLS